MDSLGVAMMCGTQNQEHEDEPGDDDDDDETTSFNYINNLAK